LLNVSDAVQRSRAQTLVVRWTVGAVSDDGFDALGWSIAGAWQLFGSSAVYVVCVNSVAIDEVRRRVGRVAAPVSWRHCEADEIPSFLRERLDEAFAEGVGWKFAPLRITDRSRELALDNDCIMWRLPDALRTWLAGEPHNGCCVVAEDVKICFGAFSALCGTEPRNIGVRGLPPGSSYGEMLARILSEHPVTLRSELDEQGLQVAALLRHERLLVVRTHEVTICSPFAPHQPYIGTCGAHFVGLNAHALPWRYYDRPASELVRENWRRLKPQVAARIAR
jgi:hypothetical protein